MIDREAAAYWIPHLWGMTVVWVAHLAVIASEAKQSIAPLAEAWIASSLSLLAMTWKLTPRLSSVTLCEERGHAARLEP
ncbi:hypothetical protein [Bradyrhizobium australiense]|uniref:Uncharacterized protein n=1 Tax=Bradyrhizobium australiense TaxID=2721161 RepID=A0A7Y4GRI9_9BRAD|nr:hypothetical protein [Bradyrhizobium australiense]NOJ40107.1 hypothetical protein [Bradyrhizobium australiense]